MSFIALIILIYDILWTHFHQTGVWNLFSIIALLIVALIPSLIGYQRVFTGVEQAYMDKMLDLVLKDNLRKSHKDDEVRLVANILTQTALERLEIMGWSARGRILVFLKKTGLLDKNNPIVTIAGARLNNTKCRGADLSDIDLSGAEFMGAKLTETNLSGSNLSGAQLFGADLSGADLRGADLRNARLDAAKLHRTKLNGANLTGARINEEILTNKLLLEDAIMPDGTVWRLKERLEEIGL